MATMVPSSAWVPFNTLATAHMLCDGSALHPYSKNLNAALKVYFVGT